MKEQLLEIGRTALFAWNTFKLLFTTRGNLRQIIDQTAFVAVRSVSTIAAAGVFVGAILILQFHLMLQRYDAESLIGGLNTSALIREIGPLLISFLLAGKIGAYTAAELGTMRVTEQIDAIECLGTHPVQYIVLPRFIAILFSSLVLLILGLWVSVVGSMVIADLLYSINPMYYAASIPRFINGWTIFSGVFKSFVYGVIVASVSCYQGFHATGGAQGVGKAVTQAAIYTNFYIVIANYVASDFLNILHSFYQAAVERGFL